MDPLGLKGCTTRISDNDDYDVVLELDKQEYPEAFGHIDDYLNGKIKGHSPRDGVFTLDRRGDNKVNVQERRNQSLSGHDTKVGYDRDKFPMAMFSEGGEGASVRYITPSDNRGAGSSISHALSQYPDGTRVKIIVN
ncbi:TPA: sporulation protein [Pasteurella multocida]|nr:sporulation protein [Pasteurella multocida]